MSLSDRPVYARGGNVAIRARLAPWQAVALFRPIVHFAMFGGVATGKSFTGGHFSILNILKYPQLTGFIGANTYDQLNQATLRELFRWLDFYRLEYVINQIPPTEWGGKREFASYKNILSVRHPLLGTPVTVFVRVLSDGDPLRGIQFSWYHLDETRDTPENTHDIVLSRMRESGYVRGLITSTTCGKDWCWKRFTGSGDGKLFGSMHVPTIESVRLGIVTQAYYDTLRHTYSPMMALQELDAKHVNVLGGRAYYAGSNRNRRQKAPWGDQLPNPDRPLVVGCDFNFSPAPCIWMVGQQGPNEWHDHIHWFGELCGTEASTASMTVALISRYPGFFYRVFGDASGGKGTTSNAGEHDYAQMRQVFDDADCECTIDFDQSNPLVKDRVENMNAKMLNALSEVHMTWNPDTCPQFDEDVESVGWKRTIMKGQGKLDDGGDNQRTHATDGAGYAVFKLLPPGKRATLIPGVPSAILQSIYQG